MRKGMAQGLARPTYYDRNPVIRSIGYVSGGIGPHAHTNRATYAVPAGKKAFCELAAASVRRMSAAGASAQYLADLSYVVNGGTEYYMVRVADLQNAIGPQQRSSVGQLGSMLPGDVVNVYTEDDSTGGTIEYLAMIKITEYDT